MKHLLSTTLLVAGILTLGATSAQAYDLNHPFWSPSKGRFASDTTFSFQRQNGKGMSGLNGYTKEVREVVSYGITDNWTATLDLAKEWWKTNLTGDYNGDHNKGNEWDLSTTYNIINDGKHFFQVGTTYGQYEGDEMEISKYYSFNVKGGVAMGKVAPYAEAWWGNNLNYGSNNDPVMGVRMAAFSNLTPKLGLDTGLKYDHETSSYIKGSYKLDAAVSYLICDNVSVRIFGDYLLHNHQKKGSGQRVQRDYTVGLGAKIAF